MMLAGAGCDMALTADGLARGLDLGAEDYITMPFQKAEFLAKVRTNIACSAILME